MSIALSIIILSFNRRDEVLETVKLCLENEELRGNSEIIVVDNCSVDGSFNALTQAYGHKIKLLKTEQNIGIAGWNKGFEIARGKYMLVLDDDSHPEYGIVKAIDYLDNHADVGILALNITGGSFTTEHFPHLFKWIGFIGCGAIIRKDVYDKIGGFADWLFIYTHEFEYGIRVIDAGYQILFFKDAMVVHRTSILNRTNQRLVTFSTRNELLIIDKYFPLQRSVSLFKCKLKNLCRYVAYEGISALPYVLQGIKKYKQDSRTITANRVSAATQVFYQEQFLPKHSIFTLLVFYLPKSLLKGIWCTLKVNKTAKA